MSSLHDHWTGSTRTELTSRMGSPFARAALYVALSCQVACGSRSGLASLEVEAPESDGGAVDACSLEPGKAQVLAKLDFQPAAVAVSGSQVFVAAWAFDGKVVRVPASGGTPVVIATEQPAVNHLAAAGGIAYWVTQGLGGTDGAVMRASSQGTETFVGGLTRPQGVAVYGGYVYFTDGVGPPGDGRVMRKSTSFGPVEILGSALGEPWDLAVDESGVTYSNVAGTGTINRVPHSGGESKLLMAGYSLPRHVALDGTYVYWSATDPDQLSRVYRLPEGPGPVELVNLASGRVEGIVADAGGVYWAVREPPGGSTYGTIHASTEGSMIASNDFSPTGIAIDEAAIYFTTIDADGAGSIRKLCRR